MSAIFETDNLQVAYNGDVVLHGVSVSLAPGHVVGIVGESGSGKTTLMHAALDSLGPGGRVVGGSVHFSGNDMALLSEKERRAFLAKTASFVPQNPQHSFSPVRTVGSQLEEAIRLSEGSSSESAHNRSASLLKELGFANPQETLSRYPFELSGGMAQRASIGLALAGSPRILFADEPTSALDAVVQAQVVSALMQANASFGVSLLVVSHNIAVLAHMASYLYVMKSGRVVEEGPTDKIIACPQSEYTRTLIASVPRIGGLQ